MEGWDDDAFDVFSPTKKATTAATAPKRKTFPEADLIGEEAPSTGVEKKQKKRKTNSQPQAQPQPEKKKAQPRGKQQGSTKEKEDVQQPKVVVEELVEEPVAVEEGVVSDPPAPLIQCSHEICFPSVEWAAANAVEEPVYPTNPARSWPFELDPFQKKSVACLEQNQSVLVSAHTSAGKTVIAEYAIALSLKRNQRVIYTSPIKALSNQKYRELHEIFEDVGLMTGDITLNPTAGCLVMTTEILRSMLYRGSEIMREVAWVVFDEIHYMRDVERGVVWEEAIILLPDTVRYVFLSATIPNAAEFASWIAKLHQQPCHVVYTDVRPTPLQHYIFPAGGEGLHLVVDEKGNFREDNFHKALSNIAPSTNNRRAPTKGSSDIYKIIKMIMERNYQPVIVFSFSKKECESLALQMAKLDVTDDDEKKNIESIFVNAIDSLSDDDKQLPQVVHILPLLKRGIGLHHSGLLPILKEVIEILFQEGLIKTLFATETFAMGLNMPAKTVVFTSVRKFDGKTFRWVTSGEYIQMSGRAGRRGKDDRGIVIMMVDEKMEPAVAKNMIRGSADPLNSSFWVGYNMLLNLLRVEEISPEYMLQRSFYQFQKEAHIPHTQKKIEKLQAEAAFIHFNNEELVAEYYEYRRQATELKNRIRETINRPMNCISYLQPGRLLKVTDGKTEWGWGILINFQQKVPKGIKTPDACQIIADILLSCGRTASGFVPAPLGSGEYQIIPTLVSLLDGISSVRVYLPKDLRTAENRAIAGKALKDVHNRFKDGIPLLDPIDDMEIKDDGFSKAIRRLETLDDKLSSEAFHTAELQEDFVKYSRKMEIQEEIATLEKQLMSEGASFKRELRCMKRVLRRLGYTSSEDIVETKGRVACEIYAANELVLSELMFEGVFNQLSVEQTVALLSCFIFDEKTKKDGQSKMLEDLAAPFRQLQETARRVAKIQLEAKIELDEEEFVGKLNAGLMQAVFAWAKGSKFSEILKMTTVFEGSIIRCMRRLEELLRELAQAAKSIGNTELEYKFTEGTARVKRDIAFAASLYLF